MEVTKEYVSEFPDPIRVAKGTVMRVVDRPAEWEGWLWCTTDDGVKGWVPAAYVDRDGGSGTMLRDYDATELTVQVGMVLEVLCEEAGWYRCRTDAGEVGWVPAGNVEITVPD